MTLKGTVTIELTDVHTGRREVVKHDNLVTNAVADILSLNPLGFRFGNYSNAAKSTATVYYDEMGASFANAMFPVCPNMIGGILLYEKGLEENPDKYYADMNNPLVGYSSNDVNSGSDPMRGSMNLNESGPLEDGNGYRFVFDFGTAQANGTISSLGLTSDRGGKAGYGSEYDPVGYPFLCVGGYRTQVSSVKEYNRDLHTKNSVISVDWSTGIGVYATIEAANTLVVGKCKIAAASISLLNRLEIPKKLMEKRITTSQFAANIKRKLTGINSTSGATFSIANACGACLLDGGDGYIWGFQHIDNVDGNSSGNASVAWIKISIDDLSFTEGTWHLDAQLMPFAYRYFGNSNELYNYTTENSIIKDGRLYAVARNQKGVYSINLSNPSDINLMECDFIIAMKYGYRVALSNSIAKQSVNVTLMAETIVYLNAYIRCGKIHKASFGEVDNSYIPFSQTSYINDPVSKNKGLSHCSGSLKYYGPFKVCFLSDQVFASNAYGNAFSDAIIYLMTPYLATINNLDTPVTKTADKTMKITYILREE